MRTSDERIVLRRAYKLIEADRHQYICHAIKDVAIDYPELWITCRALQAEIMTLISPAYSLEGWLYEHGYAKDHTVIPNRVMRTYRLAWIKHLIDA